MGNPDDALAAMNGAVLAAVVQWRHLTSNTLPKGEAPKPKTDTSSPVLPNTRLGMAAVIATPLILAICWFVIVVLALHGL